MTEKQKKVFEYIKSQYRKTKRVPTIVEIANVFGYSVSTVHDYIKRLVKKNYLIKKNHGWYEINDKYLTEKIPLYGEIAAGKPITTWQEPMDYIEVQEVFSCDNCFSVRVKGNSMIEEGIFDGDLVIAESIQDSDYNGQTVIVLIDNEDATIKKIYKNGDFIELRPANSQLKSLFYEAKRVKIVGKVRYIIRKY